MKRSLTLIVLAGLVLGAGGCTTSGMVSASAVSAVADPVMARHDAYVKADASLSDLEKQTYLRSTELMRAVLGTAQGTVPAPAPVVTPQ